MKILDKYVLTEMLSPFLFGVATFSILFFAGSQLFVITRLVAEAGQPVSVAVKYALNSIPQTLVFTFPMSVLLGALLSFGRLSGESELVAMRAGGISFIRMAAPAVVLSIVIAITVFIINNYIAPNANYTAKNIFIDAYMKTDTNIRKNLRLEDTLKDDVQRVIYAYRLIISENRMENVTIQFFKDGARIREVFSENVTYDPKTKIWRLHNAKVEEFDENQDTKYKASNQEIEMRINSPSALAHDRQRSFEEMSMHMMEVKLKKMEEAGFSTKEELMDYYKQQVYYYQKAAFPTACFVFGLFGIPLGVRPHRTSKAFGLGLSIIFIFVYYSLMSVGMTLGQNGKLDPMLAAWLPNIIFTVAGIFLMIRQSME